MAKGALPEPSTADQYSEVAQLTRLHTPEHLEDDSMEARQTKLAAENSIGVLATLLAGFAFSMVPEFSIVSRDIGNCHSDGLNSHRLSQILRYVEIVHLMSLGLVACCSCFSALVVTILYFEGCKVLSSRKETLPERIAKFDSWWDDDMKPLRKRSRRCFFACLPLFLVSMAAYPKLWCEDFELATVWGALLLAGGIAALWLALPMMK
ncbi:unnamed protein product [Polarella glacialis]|uniref:Uncharacterized protein n=1 Tax=Polarella glacialis TaxID=89957 RepID=A0A813HJC1_POLGL|nr:unnamed protein product [Polarella glacialis]